MIILVNIRQSVKEKDTSVLEAASKSWLARGVAQTENLKNADVVVAVVANVIRGVFLVFESFETDRGRWGWDLEEAPAYAAMIGSELPEDGPRWVRGDGEAWKVLPQETFDSIFESSKDEKIQVGPHKLTLLPDGNVQFYLANGYNIEVISQASKPGARERIQRVVLALAKTPAVATYQAVADALGINSARSIARSIVRNDKIDAEAGAHVIPFSFRKGNDWIVPEHEEGWSTVTNDRRTRAKILTDLGIATMLDEGQGALIDERKVITEATTLRRYLNI